MWNFLIFRTSVVSSYVVIILNVNSLGGNPFVNYFAQGIVELPAYILGRYSSDVFGRKVTQIVPMFVATLACIPLLLIITGK